MLAAATSEDGAGSDPAGRVPPLASTRRIPGNPEPASPPPKT